MQAVFDPGAGARVAGTEGMSFASAVDRARGDFHDLPGLELTMAQAVRLWSLGFDDCRYVIDALVDAGFLKWTARRTIVRNESHDGPAPWAPSRVPVRIPLQRRPPSAR